MDRKLKKYLKNSKLSLFQQRVFLTVCGIPRGEVRSYKWVARQAGYPNSFRVVGQILNKNPLPFIIPCHRVVKSNNKLGGFMFGKKAKRKLLSSEGLTIKKNDVILTKKGDIR